MPSAIRFGNALSLAHNTVIARSEATKQSQSIELVILDNLKYKYDTCGNISEVWENGKLAAKYAYDKLNRLVREDNKQLGKTTLFTYDNNGNILSKREFAFTLKDTAVLEELTETQSALYAYEGDKLLSFGEEVFVYDELDNPTLYRGKSCTREKGRQLAGYNGTTFAYDGQGRRTSKNTIQYTYDSNGNLIKQTDGVHTLEFVYDHSGVMGVKCGDNTYYYRKNVQGDVIALLDSTGKVVVQYNYDAWGNHEVKLLEQVYEKSTHIANLNPFRYRGYYYDVETGLYFLKTRYYDPQVGRFITIDDLQYLDPETINGLNLYAYCGNNPVMNVDPTGNKPKWWQWLLFGIGVALVVAATVVLMVVSGGAAAGLTGAIAIGAAKGALIGAAVGSVVGIVGGAICAGVTGADMGQSILSGFLMGFGIGAIVGAVIGGTVSGMGYAKSPVSNSGMPFNPKGASTQIGVNPNTLKISRNLNPNKIKAVKRMLKKDGMYGVIEVFRDGTIIDGNHRVFVAKMLGMLVDVIIH